MKWNSTYPYCEWSIRTFHSQFYPEAHYLLKCNGSSGSQRKSEDLSSQEEGTRALR